MGRTVRFPTTDDAEVRERDEQFVHAFVENGGNATQAAIAIGATESSKDDGLSGVRLKTSEINRL